MVRIAALTEGELGHPIVAAPKNPLANVQIKAEKIAIIPMNEVDEIVEISSTDSAELNVMKPPIVTTVKSPRVSISTLTFSTLVLH